MDDSKLTTPSGPSLQAILPSPDVLAAKSAGSAQTPLLHAADGSALAMAAMLPRAGETAAASTSAVPLAPAAQPPTPVVQVEGGLRWMLKGGVQEAQLQLHPDSLGQVTIHLKVVGGEVHARLWITEPGSMQTVQEGRPHLEQSLKEQGLQLGSFDLQQGHRPFQEAPSAPIFQEPSTLESVTARQEAPASAPTAILNLHHVELYA
jgi:flagellar hook-length control protein FliK